MRDRYTGRKSQLTHYEISQVAKGVELGAIQLLGTLPEVNRSPDGPSPSIFPVAEEVRGVEKASL